jgi:ribosome-associated toxin RatA of RatAB toxin-antitoxin module
VAVRTVGIAALFLLVAVAESGPVTAAPGVPLPLPGDHERRLTAGEIIVLDALPPGASQDAQGGTAVARVRAPVEKVWDILVDYSGHPRFYPRLVEADVLKAAEGRALVRYVAAIGFLSFTFHMDKHHDAARRRIEWQLAPGHSNSLFRENSGYWQVDGGDGVSLVTYGLAVRTVLPGFLTRAAERDSLVDTIKGLRRLAEGN